MSTSHTGSPATGGAGATRDRDSPPGRSRAQRPRPAAATRRPASGALRFGDPRVMALLGAVVAAFGQLPLGFTNAELRRIVAALLSLTPEEYSASRMTYDLGRLVGHGILQRLAGTHRYRVTPTACAPPPSARSSTTACSIRRSRAAATRRSRRGVPGRGSTPRSARSSSARASRPDGRTSLRCSAADAIGHG
jgi:hypothetical protein